MIIILTFDLYASIDYWHGVAICRLAYSGRNWQAVDGWRGGEVRRLPGGRGVKRAVVLLVPVGRTLLF